MVSVVFLTGFDFFAGNATKFSRFARMTSMFGRGRCPLPPLGCRAGPVSVVIMNTGVDAGRELLFGKEAKGKTRLTAAKFVRLICV